jgi:signal transduction histidine kinase
MMQENKKLSKKQNQYLSIIDNETMRLSRLIKNVLDFSRIERGIKEFNFKMLSLNRLVKDLIKVYRQQLKQNGFRLKIDLTGEDTTIRADEDALISALSNLLANAIKYSAEKKYLTVSTRNVDHQIHLCIKDKGVGISVAEQERVFDDFYRSGNRQVQSLGGLGLGLALVKRTIQAHHGEIKLESVPGQGTSFTIILPLGA